LTVWKFKPGGKVAGRLTSGRYRISRTSFARMASAKSEQLSTAMVKAPGPTITSDR
jgi:hypothetical protein